MKDLFSRHVLEEITSSDSGSSGQKVRAFYLKMPGTRMSSSLFLFTPEGIVIMGDLCPEGLDSYGVISRFGYGLDWFSGQLSEDYLCSKFLHKEWHATHAHEWVEAYIKDLKKEGAEAASTKVIALYEDIKDELLSFDLDSRGFHERLTEAGYDIDGELPGIDYDPQAAGLLCAMQQRFAELYAVCPSGKNEAKAAPLHDPAVPLKASQIISTYYDALEKISSCRCVVGTLGGELCGKCSGCIAAAALKSAQKLERLDEREHVPAT